jgi:hypothetical protein
MEAWLQLESQTLLAQKWLAYDWVLVPKLGGGGGRHEWSWCIRLVTK